MTRTASKKFFCATHGTANVVEDYGTYQNIYCAECRGAEMVAELLERAAQSIRDWYEQAN